METNALPNPELSFENQPDALKEKNAVPRPGVLSRLNKFAYGLGDAGCNFSWMFVSNFLMIFYTDVFGIGMTAVSGLMLFSRFWDAVNDPLIGSLSDKTQTRFGRYRPWLLVAAPATALILILTFWAHPEWPQNLKIIYMAITYCLLVLGYTCVNIPYGTLCGAMTQNMEERASLNTSRSVMAMIAIGIINIITVPLLTLFSRTSASTGYLCVAILYGTIFTFCLLFCFFNTKERVHVPSSQGRLPLLMQLNAIRKNRPYLLALAGQILFGFTLYGRNADILYYFTYVENDASLYTIYALVTIVPSIIGAWCFQPVFKKLENKGRSAALFALCTGIFMALLYLFNAKSDPITFFGLAALSQFFFSGFNTAIYAIIPDCVEYGEWKTGIRNDGFQYAFISLGNKIGMALGTSALALMLGQFGYVANQPQNEAVLSILRSSFSLIPALFWIITAAVLFFYKLNRKQYNQILAELAARKTKEQV